ncbi:MAG: hypothetical protein WAO78_16830 [Roseovarius sp.]
MSDCLTLVAAQDCAFHDAQILPIPSMERRARKAYYYGGYYSGRGYNS